MGTDSLDSMEVTLNAELEANTRLFILARGHCLTLSLVPVALGPVSYSDLPAGEATDSRVLLSHKTAVRVVCVIHSIVRGGIAQ